MAEERVSGPTGDGDGIDEVLETDPSGAGREGLAGGMGVSSERRGPLRGNGPEATHGVADSTRHGDPVDPPPEQSADGAVGGPEKPTPEDTTDYRQHESDPQTAQRHGT